MHSLIVGLDYVGTRAELKGCENDAMAVFDYLASRDDCKSIKVMFECTKQELLEELDRLCSLDSDLWFHFSGHGMQTLDRDGDEADGKDEAIITSDFRRVRDDELTEIFQKVKRTLYCVVDACNSGTIVDMDRLQCPGRVVLLSASLDWQKASESKFNGQTHGALTYALLQDIVGKPEDDPLNLDCALNIGVFLEQNGYSQQVQYAEAPVGV